MSSNSSGNSDPLEAITTPYLKWLEKEVFPVVVGISLILMLFIGIILNSILMYAVRKRRLGISSAQSLLVNLIVLDFVAYLTILLPSAIVSLAKKWVLSDFVCIVSGGFFTTCFLMTFYMLILIFVERWLKLTNSHLYDKTFGKTKVLVIIIIVIWIICFIVGLLPSTGWCVLEYISYQHLCNIQHKSNKTVMNLLFAFGLYIPSFTAFVFLIFIAVKRKEIIDMLSELQFKVDEIKTKIHKTGQQTINNNNWDLFPHEHFERNGDKSVLSMSDIDPVDRETTTAPEIEVLSSEIIQNGDVSGTVTSRSEQIIKNELFVKSFSNENKQSERTTVVGTVYNRSQEYMDIHLTITYAIMLGVDVVIWAPYVIICYLDVYETLPVWGGGYSFVVLISHMTYIIKPIIYLSHNKVFRDAAYQTFPESVRTRTKKVQNVLQKTMKKGDDFVFLQGTHSSSVAAVDETEVKSMNKNELRTFSSQKKARSKKVDETAF